MHSSCLSYLNPASNRTIIVQRNYKGNCECEEQSVLQLISITAMKLSLLSTSEFNASFSPRICPSLLLLIVSVVGLSTSASHSSSEWWNCLHSPPTASQCCLFPRSSLLTFTSESSHFLSLSIQGRATLYFGIQRIDFHLWARRQFFKT